VHELLYGALKNGFGDESNWPLKRIAFARYTTSDSLNAFLQSALNHEKQLIVADSNTFNALGRKVHEITHYPYIVYDNEPLRPELNEVEKLSSKLSEYNGVIAVGSGTISDICKYASYLARKPYIILPTAASMNGYTSANASILSNGKKESVKAHLPQGMYIDSSVIAKAPERLTAAGFGDVMCRQTVQTDWLMSHLLIGTPYNNKPFEMLADIENKLVLSDSDKDDYFELLMQALIISGLGMYLCGGSEPASQAEHMLVHTLGTLHPHVDANYLHGEAVGVCSAYVDKLQRDILKKGLLQPHAALEKGDFYKYSAVAYAKMKLCNFGEALAQLQNIPRYNLLELFKNKGTPYLAEHLGLTDADIGNSITYAATSRDRLTILDFC